MSSASAPALAACSVNTVVSRSDCDPVAATTGTRFGTDLDGEVDEAIALLHCERRGLRRRTVDQNPVGAIFHLKFDQAPKGFVVHLSVPERRDQTVESNP